MGRNSKRTGLKKSDLTRLTILEAAAKLLREKSYADVRLSDIAAAAGIQTGSLYYHFESREALVEQILVDGVDRVFRATVARVEAMPPQASPREKFACAIRAHLETMHEFDDYVAATVRIINQVPQTLVAARRERRRAYLDYWRKLFVEAEAAGVIRPGINVSVCRMLLMGMLNWSMEWFRKDGLSATEVGEQASRLLLDGIMLPEGQTLRITKKKAATKRAGSTSVRATKARAQHVPPKKQGAGRRPKKTE